MDIFEEEAARASLYRDNWDKRIAARAEQLRRLAGNTEAAALHDAFAPIHRRDNYIEPHGSEDGEGGGYETPYDADDSGAISSSPVRLSGTRHASDQNGA